ncbi:hypothetical protein D3C77_341010 [compost metagenome]
MGIRWNDAVHMVCQSNFRGLQGDLVIHLLGLFVGHAILLGQNRIHVFAGVLLRIGSELEAAEADLNLIPVSELLQSCFEFSFADIAERTSEI